MPLNIYVTIKATLRCNLACRYCYGRDNHAAGAEMTTEEAMRGIDFATEYAKVAGARSITFCWHGGEPLLMADQLPSLIDHANAACSAQGIKAVHGTQTNATLLTPSTYGLIRKYFGGFVGVSLDLYSPYRTYPDGRTSTNTAIDNLDRALAAGLQCGAINLITKDNLSHIADIYDFYKQRKMNVRLARVFPISVTDAMQSPMYVSDEEFATALIEYFNLWAADPQPACNTDIVKLVADLLLGSPSICLREAECHKRYLALSPGGDIFSCAEFDTPDTVIGNFLTQSPQEFAQSDARERLAARAPVPAQCRQCRYLPTCNGSCLRERYVLGYPYRCRSNRLYWDHVTAWLQEYGCSLYMLLGKSPAEKRETIDRIFKKR